MSATGRAAVPELALVEREAAAVWSAICAAADRWKCSGLQLFRMAKRVGSEYAGGLGRDVLLESERELARPARLRHAIVLLLCHEQVHRQRL